MGQVSTTAGERLSLSFNPSQLPRTALTLALQEGNRGFLIQAPPFARGIVTAGQDGDAGLASGVQPRIEPFPAVGRTRPNTPRFAADTPRNVTAGSGGVEFLEVDFSRQRSIFVL
jgi:hypothetical protein